MKGYVTPTRHVERTPLELREGLEEKGNERVDVACCILGGADRLAKIGVAETNTHAMKGQGLAKCGDETFAMRHSRLIQEEQVRVGVPRVRIELCAIEAFRQRILNGARTGTYPIVRHWDTWLRWLRGSPKFHE